MAKFILAENDKTILDHLSSEEINQLFSIVREKTEHLEGNDRNNKKRLSGLFESFLLTVGGDYIPVQKARKMQHAFDQEPNSITVLASLVKDFISKVKVLIANIALPADYEWGVRLYVGFNDDNRYGIVIVPAQGLKPFGSNTHEYVEKGLWSATYPFFALVPSQAGMIYDIDSCKKIIKKKDSIGVAYQTEVVSFSWDKFSKVMSDFDSKGYATIELTFARIDVTENLTITIEAFDQAENPVIVNTGKPVLGICFDQGDLIPPPSPVPDTSF